MKDSGERDYYHGGAQRDKRQGKGRYDLISPIALSRLARVYEEGAKGKGDRNWEEGIPLSRFFDSAIRHINQYLSGMRDEDHLTQAAWNLFGVIHTQDQIEKGNLPCELDDLPFYMAKSTEAFPAESPASSPQVPRIKSFEECRT